MPMTPSAAMIAEGKALYAKSCVTCHGPNGEGTALGPKVAGHSALATKTQVRNPRGEMPAFPQLQLSEAHLEQLASYLASLAPPQTPAQQWEQAPTENIYYWMAMAAVKANDTPDAQHHLRDSLVYIDKPEYRAGVNKALDLLATGNTHDAGHEIEELVGTPAPSGISLPRFHIVLTMRALKARDAGEATHHLKHFQTRTALKETPTPVIRALDFIAKSDFHEAEHEVDKLLRG
ncbi:MAG: cytochrome c [Chloroflexi bacterium]|nr:cytochrome c [Chloroflexota bacterium]